MEIKTKKIVGYTILGIFAVSFYVVIMKYNRDENQRIFSNPGYTVGELTYFSNAKRAIGVPGLMAQSAKPSEIKYKYVVNNNNIENKYVDGIFNVPFSGPIAGEKYVVIYLKTNPQKSRMLFDYPIKDTADFARYMKEFKTNPPKH